MPFRTLALCGICLLLALTTFVAAQSSSLSGIVTDANGTPVKGARVSLKREAVILTSTTTDDAGRFTLNAANVEGARVIVTAAGFSQYIETPSPARELNIKLSIASLTDSVIVSAEAEDYVAATSTTGTKLDIPRLELAQSVSVIPRKVFDDRVLVRLTETADNVAGVRALTGYTGTLSNNYIIRGFSPGLNYSSLRNGFAEYAFLSQRDVANIERIEFLKGPASLLYGANEVGGVVNTVTKKPLNDHRYELGLTGGGFGFVRPTIDLTGPLNANKSLLYRVNFAYDKGDSYRDLVNNENIFLAPALVWKLTSRTTLGIELEMARFRNDFDRGFVLAPVFLSEPVNKNFGEPWSDARNRQINLMLNLTHQFNDNWSARSGFSHIRSETKTNVAGFGFVPLAANGRTINRDNFATDEFSHNYNSQNEIYGRFSTGGIKHQLVAGGEFTRYQFAYTFAFRTLASIDRVNPVYGALPGFSLFGFNDDSFSNAGGLYVQDQISLTERLKLTLGGRFSFLDSTTRDFVTKREKNNQRDNDFLPRVGLLYQLTDSTSAYFSFTNSFQPNFLGGKRGGGQFIPTRGRQYEVGLKQAFFSNRLFASLAYYELAKRDVLVPDPDDFTFTFSIQVGEEKSRGFEAELTGQLTRNWNVIFNYSALDAYVSKDVRGIYLNNKLPGAARHAGGIYSNYEFERGALRGFSAGIGLYATGRRVAALPNPTWQLPGYARADVNFGYRRENWRLNVAVKNLNDKRYFDIGGFNSMMPQASRHAVASVNYVF